MDLVAFSGRIRWPLVPDASLQQLVRSEPWRDSTGLWSSPAASWPPGGAVCLTAHLPFWTGPGELSALAPASSLQWAAEAHSVKAPSASEKLGSALTLSSAFGEPTCRRLCVPGHVTQLCAPPPALGAIRARARVREGGAGC